MKLEEFKSLMVDRPKEGVFSLGRNIYLDEELFELEMKQIFEGTWIYLAHESQLAEPHDFFTTWIGRRPVVLVRGDDHKVRGFINACSHRAATLWRTQKGNRKFNVCPYHGWSYDNQGALIDVKDEKAGGYPAAFNEEKRDLTPITQLDSYRGFIFGCLRAEAPPLKTHLGESKQFIDLVVDQSPAGLEVLKGRSVYTYKGNWKYQPENGVDGYHVTSVHANYFQMVQHRLQEGVDNVKSIANSMSLMETAGYDLGGGHTLGWASVGDSSNRPLAERKSELEKQFDKDRIDWMLERSRNLAIFPNVFLMDQTSTQLRILRPLSVNTTEVIIYCIAPVGESKGARSRRVRQYEDFFNATGMATPDDLTEFEACQRGIGGLHDSHQNLDRGLTTTTWGSDEVLGHLNVDAVASGLTWDGEAHMQGFYREWFRLLQCGLQQ